MEDDSASKIRTSLFAISVGIIVYIYSGAGINNAQFFFGSLTIPKDKEYVITTAGVTLYIYMFIRHFIYSDKPLEKFAVSFYVLFYKNKEQRDIVIKYAADNNKVQLTQLAAENIFLGNQPNKQYFYPYQPSLWLFPYKIIYHARQTFLEGQKGFFPKVKTTPAFEEKLSIKDTLRMIYIILKSFWLSLLTVKEFSNFILPFIIAGWAGILLLIQLFKKLEINIDLNIFQNIFII